MRLTVLGKSPSWQDAGGACSGYLIEEDGNSVLLDCGNGVFSKLRLYCDYTAVDAVVISHLHADHILDLVPFAYALTYAPRQQPTPVDRWPGTDKPARPQALRPPRCGGAVPEGCRSLGQRGPDRQRLRARGVRARQRARRRHDGFRFQDVPHFTETFAVDISSTNGGGRITYGADCSPNEKLVEFAQGTDLLIIEATLPRPERTGVRGHLTPQEAAEHAKRAGVKRVLLTHVSDELDRLWVHKCACRAFDGPVEVAREGAVFET